MVSTRPDAVAVGAGVVGLTTAVCLAEAGLRVTVVARAAGADHVDGRGGDGRAGLPAPARPDHYHSLPMGGWLVTNRARLAERRAVYS